MTLRWLHWGTADFQNGLGGVEIHAQSVTAPLREMGCTVSFSNRDSDLLKTEWDVIETHGSSIRLLPLILMRLRFIFSKKKRPIWIHMLHGTTLGRMIACREWFWLGGYRAVIKETGATLLCDGLASIHERLYLFWLGRILGKPCKVVSNGYDIPQSDDSAPASTDRYWAYLGRGNDHVKDSALAIASVVPLYPHIQLRAAPGEGFEMHPEITACGRLSRDQTRNLLENSRGLLLTSRYEGLPLVVLEALGLGIPVVSTDVGGVRSLPGGLDGLIRVPSRQARDVALAIKTADSSFNYSTDARNKRAAWNRKLLLSWNQVARLLLKFADHLLEQRRDRHGSRNV